MKKFVTHIYIANSIVLISIYIFFSFRKPKGYSDTEIEALFAKYDLDGDRVLNIEEQKRMYQDLANESEEIRKALKELEATSKE
jgi:hypothetical protein